MKREMSICPTSAGKVSNHPKVETHDGPEAEKLATCDCILDAIMA